AFERLGLAEVARASNELTGALVRVLARPRSVDVQNPAPAAGGLILSAERRTARLPAWRRRLVPVVASVLSTLAVGAWTISSSAPAGGAATRAARPLLLPGTETGLHDRRGHRDPHARLQAGAGGGRARAGTAVLDCAGRARRRRARRLGALVDARRAGGTAPDAAGEPPATGVPRDAGRDGTAVARVRRPARIALAAAGGTLG